MALMPLGASTSTIPWKTMDGPKQTMSAALAREIFLAAVDTTAKLFRLLQRLARMFLGVGG